MKNLIKILSITFFVFLIIFIFRFYFFNKTVKYKIISEKDSFSNVSRNLTDNILIWDMIDESQNETTRMLTFTFNKCDVDVEKLKVSHKTNCIGYANVFSNLLKAKFIDKNVDKNWKIKHSVAEIYFLGINVNKLTSNPFFKDHDIVVIENKLSGENIAVDPTLFDYFGIDRISLKK